MKKLTVRSFFTGCGGLDLVFHSNPQYEFLSFSEINKHACRLLDYKFPTIKNLGDISKIGTVDQEFDFLIASPPCTGFSSQGKQEGFNNVQSNLFKHLLPIIDSGKPKYIFLENVHNLATEKRFKEAFNYVKESIKEKGYTIAYDIFDSSNYGTAQQRKRVFIFGVREDVYRLESYSLHAVLEQHEIKIEQSERYVVPNVISWSKSTRKLHFDYRIRTDGLMNTLTTGDGCNGQSTGNLVLEDGSFRFLKVSECEQTMTWPIGFTFAPGVSKREQYRMCGNGVVSNCVIPIKQLIEKLETL